VSGRCLKLSKVEVISPQALATSCSNRYETGEASDDVCPEVSGVRSEVV
jgi:hypothetical protein